MNALQMELNQGKLAQDKTQTYQRLLKQVEALIDPNLGWVGNYANVCAAIQQSFKHWWCGFYFVNSGRQLELGPFQGPAACTLIDFNKGVCGTAWARKETIIVPDVHQFEGHIACSAESNSEIVIPVKRSGNVIAVLDIDSTNFNEFDEIDQDYLEQIVELLPGIGG